ncbi:hypothetical protein MLD38_023455 [Melastoma candidum]|uniref:Uncharacterized protein n=1 Tax=Melastoma candidum TaxID=119954 RepID=A0ACB9NVT8_9MYRT|nr:hypothetical protein MLD38_023455 [Melastoma candidum]
MEEPPQVRPLRRSAPSASTTSGPSSRTSSPSPSAAILQQWFEYCPKTKKHSCPVCKQTCAADKVCHLYSSRLVLVHGGWLPVAATKMILPLALRKEVNRLEAKYHGCGSTREGS